MFIHVGIVNYKCNITSRQTYLTGHPGLDPGAMAIGFTLYQEEWTEDIGMFLYDQVCSMDIVEQLRSTIQDECFKEECGIAM